MNLVAPAASAAAFNAVRRMLSEEVSALRSPAPVAAILAAADESGGSASEGLAGQLAGRVVPATVISRLGAGAGVVDIGGERVAVRAQLPAEGEPVNLRFVGAQATQAATAAGNLPASVTPATGSASASAVSLGPLAQTLSEVANAPLAPLDLGRIAASPGDPRGFAEALAAQVRDSGAFYESHLARWSRGDYPLESIRREPQANAPEPRAAVRPAGDPALAPATSPRATPGIDSASQPIVREQLDLIENRCLTVSMEAWAGQRVDLEIVDEREARGQRADPSGAWSTRIGLDLPNLGRLEASLSLIGDRLRLGVRAADPDALEARGADLGAALKRAGITLTSLRIDRDPDA
jgi:hypothetical protein